MDDYSSMREYDLKRILERVRNPTKANLRKAEKELVALIGYDPLLKKRRKKPIKLTKRQEAGVKSMVKATGDWLNGMRRK